MDWVSTSEHSIKEIIISKYRSSLYWICVGEFQFEVKETSIKIQALIEEKHCVFAKLEKAMEENSMLLAKLESFKSLNKLKYVICNTD